MPDLTDEDRAAIAADARDYVLLQSRYRWLPRNPSPQIISLILLVDALTVNHVWKSRP